MSTFFCLGNMLICTILARQHGYCARNTAADAASFLLNRHQKWLGLESLAFAFSLPQALLLWGALLFYAAMAWVCLYDTSSVTITLTAINVGVVSSSSSLPFQWTGGMGLAKTRCGFALLTH